MLELFTVAFGIVFGLWSLYETFDTPAQSISYSVCLFCLSSFGFGLVIFFVVGVTTRQNWRVVLSRVARVLSIFLPISAASCAINGAVLGHFLLPLVLFLDRTTHPAWHIGVSIGLFSSFPIAVFAATWRAVSLLRREHQKAFVDEQNREILEESRGLN